MDLATCTYENNSINLKITRTNAAIVYRKRDKVILDFNSDMEPTGLEVVGFSYVAGSDELGDQFEGLEGETVALRYNSEDDVLIVDFLGGGSSHQETAEALFLFNDEKELLEIRYVV